LRFTKRNKVEKKKSVLLRVIQGPFRGRGTYLQEEVKMVVSAREKKGLLRDTLVRHHTTRRGRRREILRRRKGWPTRRSRSLLLGVCEEVGNVGDGN